MWIHAPIELDSLEGFTPGLLAPLGSRLHEGFSDCGAYGGGGNSVCELLNRCPGAVLGCAF